MDTSPHVIVAGGGIGGLSLAQGLRKAGFRATVLERDPSAGHRPQGYRISLKETGAAALRACLPPGLYDLAVATSIRPATRMTFLDTRLVPKFSKDVPPQLPGLDGFGVNRLTLREILLSGLDVRFGTEFTRYEPLPGARVRAHLADGSALDGDLLAGADGVGSRVRAQLLPDAVVDRLDWALYGRTVLTPDLLAATPPDLVDTFNRVTAPDHTAISVATCRPCAPVAEAAARHAPGLRLTDVPGYFSWTLTAPGPRPDDTSPTALHRLALATVAGWHEGVRRIVERADTEATFLVHTHSARRVRPWDEPAVTLLGDAVHSMSPGRGEGANVALCDAHTLSAGLAAAVAEGRPLAEAKAAYEHAMLDYAFTAVEASLQQPFAPFARPVRPPAR